MKIDKEQVIGLSREDILRDPDGCVSLDRSFLIPVYSEVCSYCRHLRRDVHGDYCAAFPGPEMIPLEIWMGVNNHRAPFPGDHGIQFEPHPDLHPDVLRRVMGSEGEPKHVPLELSSSSPLTS